MLGGRFQLLGEYPGSVVEGGRGAGAVACGQQRRLLLDQLSDKGL